MSAWFNFATTRGDIIGQIPGHDATNVEELGKILSEDKFITIVKPISPKTTPLIYKVCQECGQRDALTSEEEEAVTQGQADALKCSACGSNKLSAAQDRNRMNVTYTSIGTLFDGSSILIGTNQIANVFLLSNEDNLEQISDQLYSQSDNVYQINNDPGLILK